MNLLKKAESIVRSLFGKSDEAIECIEIGNSPEGSVIKCDFIQKQYIVKCFNDVDFGKNEIKWFQHAARLGIGPRVYQVDEQGSYLLVEYIEGHALTSETISDSFILEGIAYNLARLHSSSLEGVRTKDIFPQIYTKYEKLVTGGELQMLLASWLTHVRNIEKKIKGTTTHTVPCHNDLNPGNFIIAAKDNKIIFLDWGEAALGNPYYDITAFFILNVISPEQELFFLKHYDAELLEPYWQNYLSLLRQVAFFERALNILSGVQLAKKQLLFESLPPTKPLTYYIGQLMKGTDFEIEFFYEMAVASLRVLAHN